MIDAFIVRPVLKVTTWIKRHPLLALLTLLLLFVLPPILVVIYQVLSGVVNITRSIFGATVAGKVGAAAIKAATWLSAKPHRCYWVALGVGLFAPLAGAALAAWCFLDTFKTYTGDVKIETPRDTTTPPPDVEPPTPDLSLSDAFDDFFGAI